MLPRNRTRQRLDSAMADRMGLSTEWLFVRGIVRPWEELLETFQRIDTRKRSGEN